MASNTGGDDDLSMVPFTDRIPGDPDMAREVSTSIGVAGLEGYPTNIFSRASDSQVSFGVDTSRKSDKARAVIATQASSGAAVDAEIESPTPVRTPHQIRLSDSNAATDSTDSRDTTNDVPANSGFRDWIQGNLVELGIGSSMSPSIVGDNSAKSEQQTGKQSKIQPGEADTTGGSERLLADSLPETQNTTPGDMRSYAHCVKAIHNLELEALGSEISRYLKSITPPVKWDSREGRYIDYLLEELASLDNIDSPEVYPPFNSDRDDLSRDNKSPTVCGSVNSKLSQLPIQRTGTSTNDLFDRTEGYGGIDANHGLQLMNKCLSEDRQNISTHEGIDINDALSGFTDAASGNNTAKISSNGTRADSENTHSIYAPNTSLGVFSNGGVDVTIDLTKRTVH